MQRTWLFAPFLGAILAVGLGWERSDAIPKAYLMYVASESEDEVAVLRFTPGAGLTKEKVVAVGWWPAEIESPHGVFVDPAGGHWYLTLGHGFPFGSLVKYEIGADTVAGVVSLGLFPSTIAVSPQGGLAIAVNSNFHGDRVPGTVSVVDLETMIEVEQIETCTMPHGSRFSPDGGKHYSVCMVDDRLVEIDATRLELSRLLDLKLEGDGRCSPTWVVVTSHGTTAYVACNAGNQIVEVDLDAWRVRRRLPAEGKPYNLTLTNDGARLVATLKGKGAVGVWDLTTGALLGEIPTTRKVTHGVIATPDNRYAFVSVEGIGGEPGTVDAIDLGRLEKVASIDIGKQAGGISFWKTIE